MSMSNTGPATNCSIKTSCDAGSRSQTAASKSVTTSPSRATKSKQVLPTAAGPAVRTFFDPWNSSSTGHQRAENRLSGSTSWRDSRNLKLAEQHRGGLSGGGNRVADTVGAGSEDFGKDGRKANGGWEKGAKGLRTGGQKSLAEVWAASKPCKKSFQQKELKLEEPSSVDAGLSESPDDNNSQQDDSEPQMQHNARDSKSGPSPKQIFHGLCFYTNGSTAPLVSDHKLKHMLAAHGAQHSIALGRRSVTHVILGTTSHRGGAGGGLAATKIQKEIGRTGGKAVKFITVEWVLDSIKAQRRLPESNFLPLVLAPKNQNSVSHMLGSNSKAATSRTKH